MKLIAVFLTVFLYASSANAMAVKCADHAFWAPITGKMHTLVKEASDRLLVLYDIINKNEDAGDRTVFVFDNQLDEELYVVVKSDASSCGFMAIGDSRVSLIKAINGSGQM